MFKHYIFYNPLAGGEEAVARIEEFASRYEGALLYDVTKGGGYRGICEGLDPSDKVTVSGGDGTLNRFFNEMRGFDFPCDVYYYPSGTGNDFMREMIDTHGGALDGEAPHAVRINDYLKDLPVATVTLADGKVIESEFINGVGYGIDGYCCVVGDSLREAGEKHINYTGIAIKGLLFHYKPCDVKVTVDGVEHIFKKAWLAPVMKGKYYGGGMIPTPEQTRDSGELSVLIFHGSGKLKTLMIFPSIFKGEHVKKKKNVTVLSGKEILVEYSAPRPAQIDGETVKDVKSVFASSKVKVKN
jgi:diacylglycerol kinase family enzyme